MDLLSVLLFLLFIFVLTSHAKNCKVDLIVVLGYISPMINEAAASFVDLLGQLYVFPRKCLSRCFG